jgi:hypothetical protein
MSELFRRVWDVDRRSVQVALAVGAIATAAALIGLSVARTAAASRTQAVTLAPFSAVREGKVCLLRPGWLDLE